MEFIEEFLHSGTLISFDKKDVLLGWGNRYWSSVHANRKEYAFYFPDFFLEQPKPWFYQQKTQVLPAVELAHQLSRVSKSCAKWTWSPPNQALYTALFQDLKKSYLEAGLLKKGVPFAQALAKGTMTRQQKAQSLLSLLKVHQDSPCYLYGFWDDSQGILGATPEILFSKESGSGEVETVACAGTRASDDAISLLLEDPKELAEHRYVIDGITKSLSSIGKIAVHDMQVLQLPHIKHLYTPITFKPYHAVTFTELVKMLHPTPALGTYPKEAGNSWLRAIQKKINRQRFGAPVGFLREEYEKFACYVAIRNMQWQKSQISLCAGGGVVLQSELEKEWKEILLKINTIKKMLALEIPS